MDLARQTTCWGALPRRQRRLERSSLRPSRSATLVLLPTLGCVAAIVACLSVAPIH